MATFLRAGFEGLRGQTMANDRIGQKGSESNDSPGELVADMFAPDGMRSVKLAQTAASTVPREFPSIAISDDSNSGKTGLKALEAFFRAPEVATKRDGSGSLTVDAIDKVEAEAIASGNVGLRAGAEFVKRHFEPLSRLSDNDALTLNPVISKDDLKYLPHYEKAIQGGYPWRIGTDPRIGTKDYAEAVAKGATLGAGVQAIAAAFGPASYAVGMVAAMPVTIVGAVGGFIGGNLLGEHIEGTRNALLSYPLGMGGLWAGIGAGVAAASYAWGPTLGGAVGFYMVDQHGIRSWERNERPAYETMFKELRQLKY